MTKRIIALLTFLLLLPALALADCTHHNEDGVPYPLIPQGYIPPQAGVPGYTGDQCCTNCGEIVIRGSEIPALSPENEEEYNWNNKQEQEIKPVNPSSGQEIPSVSNGQSEPSVSSAEQPQGPVSPTQPESPNTPANLPKTGDSSNPVLWIGLILIGIVGLASITARKAFRKKK